MDSEELRFIARGRIAFWAANSEVMGFQAGSVPHFRLQFISPFRPFFLLARWLGRDSPGNGFANRHEGSRAKNPRVRHFSAAKRKAEENSLASSSAEPFDYLVGWTV